MHSDDWYERQYNTSFSVPNEDGILAQWIERAANTRARFPFLSDISYGPHQRELLDFYRAPKPKGTLIYVHGGYWRGLSKLETSWVADDFVERGISVALINYPLCPEVSLQDIRGSITRAFVHIYKHVLNAAERENIVVTGHSAGGHLAAFHLTVDWTQFGLAQNPFSGVIPISGVFDVAPLMHTSMNDDIRITAKTALSLNLMASEVKSHAPLVFVVGGDEPSEFHRQSADLAKAWGGLRPKAISLPSTNHFTVVDALADPAGEINKIACSMLSSFR